MYLLSSLLRAAWPITFIALASTTVLSQSNESIYTSLEGKPCRTVKTSEADYMARCPGVGGYKLVVTEGDLRQNITVVTPQGREHSLDLWSVISGGFSHLGKKAEWRVTKSKAGTPVALIVRFNASEDPAKPEKESSYLAVAKITNQKICITAKIAPGATANEDARKAADEAASKPCLSNGQ